MGHKVGWVTLHAGIAGGADIILIPEIPYDLRHVIEAIKRRNEHGKQFTILAVAEGAISKEDAQLSKKQYKAKLLSVNILPLVMSLLHRLKKATGQEARVTIPGHTQRGGSPVPFDRVISSRLGVAAAELIAKEDYGKLLIMKGYDVTTLPLEKNSWKVKVCLPDDQIVLQQTSLESLLGIKKNRGCRKTASNPMTEWCIYNIEIVKPQNSEMRRPVLNNM